MAAVHSLFMLAQGSPARRVFEAQCTGAGSTLASRSQAASRRPSASSTGSQIFKLAVSLGGTESLASHPASTTHSGVDQATRERIGVTEGLVRFSIGVEHEDDLIADLAQAFDRV